MVEFALITSAISKLAPQASQLLIKHAQRNEAVIKVLQESELFIGISSGLSWLAWAAGVKSIIISGFTDENLEPTKNISRLINKEVCNNCWGKYEFDPGDWNWCPVNKDTEKQFECSKSITASRT